MYVYVYMYAYMDVWMHLDFNHNSLYFTWYRNMNKHNRKEIKQFWEIIKVSKIISWGANKKEVSTTRKVIQYEKFVLHRSFKHPGHILLHR